MRGERPIAAAETPIELVRLPRGRKALGSSLAAKISLEVWRRGQCLKIKGRAVGHFIWVSHLLQRAFLIGLVRGQRTVA